MSSPARKAFISGGGENEIYVTMVRTGEDGPKGITALVIEKDMKGVSFGAQEKKLGWHSQPTAQVNFDEVRVPVANRVGGEGEGFRIAMMGLDGGRLNIGACSLGGAQRCLDEAVNYTKERKQFGTAIADFQNTQFMLADMETELQAARQLLYAAAVKVTANAPDKTKFAAMAKRLATDTGIVGGRPRAAAARRLRLSAGLSDRALLARPSRPFDPRGHQPGDADDRRPGADPPVTSAFTFGDLTRRLQRSRRKDDEGRGQADPAVRSASPSPRRPASSPLGLAMKPAELMEVQLAAAKQWGDFWTGALSGRQSEKPRDRRFAAPGMAGRCLLPRDPRRLSARVEAAARRGRRWAKATPARRRWRASCSTNI